MKIESPAFTRTDVEAFLDSSLERERALLVGRFESATARLSALGPKIEASTSEQGEWSAHEVLAHIAAFSKFYGAMVYKVGTAQIAEVDIVQAAQMRDPVDEQMAQQASDELLQAALSDHQRTLRYLRTASTEELRREVPTSLGRPFRTEEMARFLLVNHLEQHVEQLEQLLA